VQTTAIPSQLPLAHVSFVVQVLLSSQKAPSFPTGFEQSPVAESHVPAVWHTSCATQANGEPLHVPFVHVSPVVQASASVHCVPSAATGLSQMPVAGSQAPTTWHPSDGEQTTGLFPKQLPPWQVSI